MMRANSARRAEPGRQSLAEGTARVGFAAGEPLHVADPAREHPDERGAVLVCAFVGQQLLEFGEAEAAQPGAKLRQRPAWLGIAQTWRQGSRPTWCSTRRS